MTESVHPDGEAKSAGPADAPGDNSKAVERSREPGDKDGPLRKWAPYLVWTVGLVIAVLFWMTRNRQPEIPIFSGTRAPSPSAQRSTSAQQPLAESEFSTFRGNRRHTGRTRFSGPAHPRLRARIETTDHVSAQPSQRGNLIVFGSHDGTLRAIDLQGQARWTYRFGASIYGTPLLTETGVFVGSDDHQWARLSETGARRASVDLGDEVDTSPVMTDQGILYVGSGRDLVSLWPSGQIRFRFRTHGKVFSSPAVADDGTVYFGSQDNHLYAMAPSGELRYRFRTGDDVDASPVIDANGNVYFGSDDGHFYSITHDGQLRFRVDLGGYIRAPAALTLGDESVVVPVFGPTPRLVRIDTADGTIRWHFTAGARGGRELGVAGAPLVDRDNNIYFGSDDNYLYSVTPAGQLRWVYESEGNVDGDPILVSDGLLAFGSDDGSLVLIEENEPAN